MSPLSWNCGTTVHDAGIKDRPRGAATATNISLQQFRSLAILAALENLYLYWLSCKLCWDVDLVSGGHIGRMMPAVNSQRQVTSGDTFTMKGCQLDQQQLTLPSTCVLQPGCLVCGQAGCLHDFQTAAPLYMMPGSKTDRVGPPPQQISLCSSFDLWRYLQPWKTFTYIDLVVNFVGMLI